MPYYFTPPVNPNKPLDPGDPCPPNAHMVDAKDRSKLFWGGAPEWVQNIYDWEQRERARYKKLEKKKRKKRKKAA